MRLLLEVVFAHGYLVRNRLPEHYAQTASVKSNPTIYALGLGLLFAFGGVLGAAVKRRRERTMATATRWPCGESRAAEHDIDPRQAFPRLESLGYG
jgi:hypothetical protein